LATQGLMKEALETQEATTATGEATITDAGVSVVIFREVTTVMTGDAQILRIGTKSRRFVRRE